MTEKMTEQHENELLARLKELGLLDLIISWVNKKLSDEEYQKKMAPKLRELTFLYFYGKLGLEFDGPIVKALREKLNPKSDLLEVVNKEEEHFTKKQAADRVWATGYELAALLDYFGFDLKVKSKTTKEGDFMAFNPNADSERPVIILWNKDNIHWDFIDGNETIPALDDGNCGYNSIAMAIAKSLEKAVTLNLEVEKDLNEAEQAIFLDSETKDQASQLKPSEKEVVMPLSQKLEVKEALIISNKKPSPDKIKFVEKQQASLLTQPLNPDEQSFYEDRAKHFSEEQKQQIESDYILALNLALQWAKEEAAYQPKNKPSLAANPSSYFFEPQRKDDGLNRADADVSIYAL